MGPLPPDIEQLQERLGELLVGLLLDARNSADGYDPRPLISGFGGLIAAMTRAENATANSPDECARAASALDEIAYHLFNRAAERLAQTNTQSDDLITELRTGFAAWITRQGGTCIKHAALVDFLKANEPAGKACPDGAMNNRSRTATHAHPALPTRQPHRTTLH
ncbi:MAG TPA: hypothetical protein VN448_00380 [Gammaproteobacteria bacterium]|jgi:hypothetical protein|nr:hypothetical protein [Gammaproteobacteria bacterium]